MNKKLKNFILGMVALVATHQSVAWDSFSSEQISSADKDKTVKVLKVREYTRSEPQGTIKLSGNGSGRATYPKVKLGYESYEKIFTEEGRARHLLETGANVNFQSKLNGTIENPNRRCSDVYLDLDGHPETVEGIFRVCEDCPDVAMKVYNATHHPSTRTTLRELFKAAECNDPRCKNLHWATFIK